MPPGEYLERRLCHRRRSGKLAGPAKLFSMLRIRPILPGFLKAASLLVAVSVSAQEIRRAEPVNPDEIPTARAVPVQPFETPAPAPPATPAPLPPPRQWW